MASHAEVKQHLTEILAKLDSMANETWIAEGFLIESLIVGSAIKGYTPDIGSLLYTLDELNEKQLAVDFGNWYATQTNFRL